VGRFETATTTPSSCSLSSIWQQWVDASADINDADGDLLDIALIEFDPVEDALVPFAINIVDIPVAGRGRWCVFHRNVNDGWNAGCESIL
jgi:hypothetical protein